MPTFYQDTQVYVDVAEFIESCRPQEIIELVKCLAEDGHCIPVKSSAINPSNYLDDMWYEKVSVLLPNRVRLTSEDEETILKIVNKL